MLEAELEGISFFVLVLDPDYRLGCVEEYMWTKLTITKLYLGCKPSCLAEGKSDIQ